MSFQFYQVLHLFSAVMLAGVAFAALANPLPERRRTILMWWRRDRSLRAGSSSTSSPESGCGP